MKENISLLLDKFKNSDVLEILTWFAEKYQDHIIFSTSLSAEDQIITHVIATGKLPIRLITLDTGRLFQETYDVLDITVKKYGLAIDVFFPESARVEKMVNQSGINLFYDSVENRRQCCSIRKTLPIRRALHGMKIWITGMRQDQSVTRSESEMFSWDENLHLLKINPLIYWTNEQVWQYIKENHIPYNELHDKGFPSIGCLPCTRAVLPGEDQRSGRWWWELPQFKECGLHK